MTSLATNIAHSSIKNKCFDEIPEKNFQRNEVLMIDGIPAHEFFKTTSVSATDSVAEPIKRTREKGSTFKIAAPPCKKGEMYLYLSSVPKISHDEILNSPIPRKIQGKAFALISSILDFNTSRHRSLDSLCPVHSDYLRGIDPNYHRWLPYLVRLGILTVDDHYINDPENPEGNCTKKYGINPEHLDGAVVAVAVESKKKNRRIPGFVEAEVRQCMRECPIRKDEALAFVREYVDTKAFLKDVRFDEDITASTVTVDLPTWNKSHTAYSYNSYTYKTENAMFKAASSGMSLIMERSRCLIENKEGYIARRQRDILISWTRQVLNWEQQCFFSSRNDQNWRLDSNFSILPSELEQFLGEKNQKHISIDICNSQHVINGQIFLNPNKGGSSMSVNFEDPAISLYCEASAKGELYEEVAKKCGMASRHEAKVPFLKLTFMHHKAQSPEKTMLKEELGEVVSFFDQMKSKFGNSAFASLLTTTESLLMIDGAYTELRQRGVWGLPKHDSIRVREEDLPVALEIISRNLFEYLDAFALKVSEDCGEGKKIVYTKNN